MNSLRRHSAKCLALLALSLGGMAAVPPPPPVPPFAFSATMVATPKPVHLLWSYSTNEINTNIVFVLRSSTNLTLPLTQWPVDKLINATNWYSTNGWSATADGTNYTFSVTNLVVPGERYYIVSASNVFWETESDFSNTLGLDPLPSQSVNLRAVKGW